MVMVINKKIFMGLTTLVLLLAVVYPVLQSGEAYALKCKNGIEVVDPIECTTAGSEVAAPVPANVSTPLGKAVCPKDKKGNELKNPDDSCKIPTDCEVEKGTDLNSENCQILNRILQFTNALSGIVAIVIVMMIVVGGIQYSSAGGDPQKVAGAKKRIYNAIFAFMAYIFMFSFLQWVVPGGVLH